MSDFGHPIRKAKIHTFSRNDDESGGAIWLARLHPYRTYPIFFTGDTEQSVIEQAEALIAKAITDHEAACIARQKATAERKAKKKVSA